METYCVTPEELKEIMNMNLFTAKIFVYERKVSI